GALPAGEAAQVNSLNRQTRPQKEWIHIPDTLQTAIRVGRPLFDRHHRDYPGMYLLNTVLGGYFGSRLMTNIREEKGFTYNIYSLLEVMRQDGFICVATEVSNEFVEETLREIYAEMEVLAENPMEEEELNMVKSYLVGNFLTMLDGPFNVSDIVRTLAVDGLPMEYFSDFVATIIGMNAADVRDLAERYLNPEDMWEVVVGKRV
ncbi:MAG: insulinase family protein, partial [Saprospiraceae bacterium]|nr:insulinase family protein [Saprospiraceae bacterium]